ncbi:MAG: UDP-N-acetylmuramoylalanine--D-glutamate ligase [Erysipelotrichaceae bacterium]|nr:MAG: UDP-N-acetylmuramoylalanine--D-glutamate [Erysipelotrichaceae bacterium]TXT18924.1 MAG: UDP-N-acetylmuramoylalanine--D-glutamate ligase [Erysipelotrichaceae bacterium]
MKVLVLGAARSGISVTKLLLKEGHQVFLNDSNVNTQPFHITNPKLTIVEGSHPESLWDENFDLVIKNPGIPHTLPFLKGFTDKNVPILNEIEYASSLVDYRYGAITGTNGKTTTTALLGELLKQLDLHNGAYGNIGIALSDLVYEYPHEKLCVALEIAAFQLIGTVHFHPTVSVIMNLTPDHLDVFKDVDEYYKAKTLVYKNQNGDDWFLRNIDDENVVAYTKDCPCRVVEFSLTQNADLYLKDGGVWLWNQKLFDLSDLKLVGMHNVQNAMVASAMAFKLGVSPQLIQEGIRKFAGVEHRIEYVKTLNGVTYYNDSKGTNAEATIVALKAFDHPVILLAGGYDKKTGFDALIPFLDHVKMMIVYGETKHQLKTLYPKAVVVENLTEATKLAHSLSKSDDVVLFSPACASYDQFDNYEQRGRLFKDLVHKL